MNDNGVNRADEANRKYGGGPAVVLSRRSRMRAWLNRLRRALAGDGELVRS